jgi:hypothetical protein
VIREITFTSSVKVSGVRCQVFPLEAELSAGETQRIQVVWMAFILNFVYITVKKIRKIDT